MPIPTFQTVRLGRGSHRGPEHGACVMELASMLAGEGFSDSPQAVCPVLAMVLRGYNDGIDDDRRQDLFALASAVVGTRRRRGRRHRARRCGEFLGVPRTAFLAPPLRRLGEAAMAYAGAAGPREHSAFLGLVEELAGDDVRLPPARSVGWTSR